MKSNEKNNSPDKIKFEVGLARLEEILSILEKGEIPLEDSIKYFKEGAALFRHLQKTLEAAEGEVKTLLEDFEGKIKTEDFPAR